MNAGLASLNAMSEESAAAFFMKACGSSVWAGTMAAGRPFADGAALSGAAERAAEALSREDWLEAFSHHPRIGESAPSRAGSAEAAAMSGREQSGMAGASDQTRREFAALNAEYERKFGHVFLICASGRSAEFMLAQLRERLGNTPEVEFANATREQRRITRLRFDRMLGA